MWRRRQNEMRAQGMHSRAYDQEDDGISRKHFNTQAEMKLTVRKLNHVIIQN